MAQDADAPAAGAQPSELSFEQALAGLEAIVERLETGELPLEQALVAFEQGVRLSRRCAEQLEASERRIEQLVREGGGAWSTRPFTAGEGEA
jgi:exodeoxyribonuclease VII small subunit